MDNSRKVVAAITVVVLVLALISLASSVGSTGWRTGGPGWGMGPGMMGRMLGPGAFSPPPAAPTPAPTNNGFAWPFASWVPALVAIAAFVLLAWLIATRNHRDKPVEKRETPLEIAKRRYVAGEITLPEYEEIVQVLTEAGETLEGTRGKSQGARS